VATGIAVALACPSGGLIHRNMTPANILIDHASGAPG